MIYKLSIYLDVIGEAFDPNLMPEAIERVFRPVIEKCIKSNKDFPYTDKDAISELGSKVCKMTKAKSVSIDFVTKTQVLAKMGK